MRSDIYYTGKDIEKQARFLEENAILKKIVETGCLHINLAGMEKAKKAGLKIDANNISLFFNPRNWKDPYNLIFAGDIIFFIFIHHYHTSGWIGNKWVQEYWEMWCESLASVLNKPALHSLKTLIFETAQLNDIKKYRKFLPEFISISNYGRCAKNSSPWSIDNNFSDVGHNESDIHFVVYSAKLSSIEYIKESGNSLYPAERLLNSDTGRANLRPLPSSLLTDNTLGHWDLWWPDERKPPEESYAAVKLGQQLEARNPEADIVKDAIAIDFGTSSTVIAMRYKGRTHLVRIGEDSHDKPGTDAIASKNPFENPTVLKFDNSRRLISTWQNEPFRPGISWDDAQCSHQAKAELASHIKSGMTSLKTWARKNPQDPPLVLTDGKGEELLFSTPAEPPLPEVEKDFKTAALNPLELYAYYLGLNLNNQLVDGGRIFTEYYMTFPVRFEKAVKERIIASFRRGLIRSLPPSLIYGCGFDVNRITVKESANEPAAFAAAALPVLGRGGGKGEDNSAAIREKLNELQAVANTRNFYNPGEKLTSEEVNSRNEFISEINAIDKNLLALKCENAYKAPAILETLRVTLKEIYPDLHSEYEKFLDSLRGFYATDRYVNFWNEWAINDPASKNCKDSSVGLNNLQTCFLLSDLVYDLNDLLNAPWVSKQPLEPTDEGVAFGVFDFGGGTTDYAMGLYRLPADQEAVEEGWEEVVDILAVSGDPDLGGEHLVHDLAFEVACANRDLLLQENISFIKPDNARYVSGTERLFFQGGIARANTRKLMERLRPLWEEGSLETEGGKISVALATEEGEEKSISLKVNEAGLQKLLKDRIASAVDEYFALLKQAFKKAQHYPPEFHVILAGNSCRSPLVTECFQEKVSQILADGGESVKDSVIIHPPLYASAENPEAVSLKTGVALGLLKTLGWEQTGIVMRKADSEEAPFPYTVGPLARGRLLPRLRRDSAYNEWSEFGLCTRTGSLLALYTLSPEGMDGTVKRGECPEIRIDFGEGHMGKRIMICPVSPDTVRFALRTADGGYEEEKEVRLE